MIGGGVQPVGDGGEVSPNNKKGTLLIHF